MTIILRVAGITLLMMSGSLVIDSTITISQFAVGLICFYVGVCMLANPGWKARLIKMDLRDALVSLGMAMLVSFFLRVAFWESSRLDTDIMLVVAVAGFYIAFFSAEISEKLKARPSLSAGGIEVS